MKYAKWLIINVILICAFVSVWHWYAEKHIQTILDTEDEVINEVLSVRPQIVICEEPPRPSFPEHWGPPPNIQLRDYVKLPEPYGYGSSTLRYWIEENQEKDLNTVSFRPLGEATPTLEESFNIPDTVPNRVIQSKK
tara:strand:+ start:17226 stop:17636 length:411 start_codon:yes stop_codon:yes gene_type:complete